MYFSKTPRETQLPAARPKPHSRPVVETVWRRRIRRAENLPAQHPFAGQILTFYSRRPAFSRTFTSASKLHRPAGTDLLSKCWSNADVPADPAEVIALAFLPPHAASCAPAFRSDARATLTRAAPFCSRRPGPGRFCARWVRARADLLCGFFLSLRGGVPPHCLSQLR
jgi:hypothetical protein